MTEFDLLVKLTEGRVARGVAEPYEERAERILDAAAGLIVRLGYGKTTIDDIARRAGVAKGTVYLHWKSRDALFVALLRRERVLLLTDAREAVAAAPGGATPRALVAAIATALARRPLLRAVLVRDLDVIGKLAHDRHQEAVPEAPRALIAYLDELRALGAVRGDLDGGALMTIVSATFTGFFFAPWLRAELTRPDDEVAGLLADTIDRALAPAVPARPTARTRTAVSAATMRLLDDGLALAAQKLTAAMGPSESRTR